MCLQPRLINIGVFVAARPTFQAGEGRHTGDDGQAPAEPAAPAGRHVHRDRPLRHGQVPRRLQRVRQRGGPLPRPGPRGQAPPPAAPRQLPEPGRPRGGAAGAGAHPPQARGSGALPPAQRDPPEQLRRDQRALGADAAAQRGHRSGAALGGGPGGLAAPPAGAHPHEDALQRVGVLVRVQLHLGGEPGAHGGPVQQSPHAEAAVAGGEEVQGARGRGEALEAVVVVLGHRIYVL